METAVKTGLRVTAAEERIPDDDRLPDENREADDLAEPDPEEASICLTCVRGRCLLDEDKPCLRYRRAMRALRKRREAMMTAEEGAAVGRTAAGGTAASGGASGRSDAY